MRARRFTALGVAFGVLSALLASACLEVDDAPPGDGGVSDAISADTAAPLIDSATRPSAPPADLDGYVEWYMAEGVIPGVAASIVTPEGVVWSRYYGYADLATERRVDEDSLFIIASVSKTVTTLALLQLVDEDLLDLDAPADDYLPYALRHPSFPDTPVTARMLLTHTSGLLDTFGVLGRVTYMEDPPRGPGEMAEAYVTPGRDLYEDENWGARPGTSYVYCNVNFAILGHLVEVIRDEDLRRVTAARIFEPLNMTTTGWFLADVDAAHLATPYSSAGRMPEPLPQNGFAYYPASSLRTTVPELSRFLTATIRNGELDGNRVLSEELSASMREPQRPDLASAQAITWRYRSVGGQTYLAHTGSTYGASVIIGYRPDAGVGFVVLTNSDAYILARLGLTDSRDALEAIFERVATESERFATN